MKGEEPVEALLMGHRFLLTVLSARPRRVRSKGREYWQYNIPIPADLARRLLQMAGEEPGTLLPLTIIMGPSPWYHLINWSAPESDSLYRRIPNKHRREIEALGLRGGGPIVLIPARPEQLRELGLDPEEPVTLDDIVEKIRERVKRELKAKKAASPRTGGGGSRWSPGRPGRS